MKWKTKSRIQNLVALLPSSLSYAAYYWLQRNFGRLKRADPLDGFSAGVKTWVRLQNLGLNPRGKIFFEVGTGRVPLVPLVYWLLGADRTITVDLNPYVKIELVRECLMFVRKNLSLVREKLGGYHDETRLGQLVELAGHKNLSLQRFLETSSIEYLSPGDAAKSGLPDRSIDFHSSFNVFEHIPGDVLASILKEGNRIVRDGGAFIHRIDYGDHFADTDSTISRINFLQYSDSQWARYSGNRYMYTNRLRHDDFMALFGDAGHQIIQADVDLDPTSFQLVKTGRLRLNQRFEGKSFEVLATTGAWIVSKPSL